MSITFRITLKGQKKQDVFPTIPFKREKKEEIQFFILRPKILQGKWKEVLCFPSRGRSLS
jgi:hypothetical protein